MKATIIEVDGPHELDDMFKRPSEWLHLRSAFKQHVIDRFARCVTRVIGKRRVVVIKSVNLSGYLFLCALLEDYTVLVFADDLPEPLFLRGRDGEQYPATVVRQWDEPHINSVRFIMEKKQ